MSLSQNRDIHELVLTQKDEDINCFSIQWRRVDVENVCIYVYSLYNFKGIITVII